MKRTERVVIMDKFVGMGRKETVINASTIKFNHEGSTG